MRQLTYVGPRKIEWWDVPGPKVEDGREAIVQPVAVTRCDLDYFIANGATGWAGPFALGHEIGGVVVDVGDRVRSFEPGDRVVVPFQISCGTCGNCKQGFTSNCEGVPFRSSYGMAPLSGVEYGGALSDRVRVPFADHMLVACPDDVPLSTAAGIADQASDGFQMIAPHLAANPGARVLIVGGIGQGIGLLVAQSARALGAGEVVYLDDDPARLTVARTLGITVVERTTYDGVAPGAPYPITIDANISPEGLALAIRSTQHGGICHRTYGDMAPISEVPLQDMYSIGLSLHIARVHVRHVMPTVLKYVQRGDLHPDQVITKEVTFEDAAEAILDPTIKVLFLNE